MSELVEAAREIAIAAHEGQPDKSGAPYIGHVSRVAAAVEGEGPTTVCVAWLHDVVEDTGVSLDELANAFSREVVDAVDAITRRRGEADDYYARVQANPLALKVKLSDIADNADPERLAELDEPVRARLTQKYANALLQLGVE